MKSALADAFVRERGLVYNGEHTLWIPNDIVCCTYCDTGGHRSSATTYKGADLVLLLTPSLASRKGDLVGVDA